MRFVSKSPIKLALLACALCVMGPGAFLLTRAVAQQNAARTISGKVTDKSDVAIKGAVVHLKDVRSLAQKSFITDDDGTFRFGQVSSTADFEIWAEAGGKKSDTKSISSFDSKNSFVISLKIAK